MVRNRRKCQPTATAGERSLKTREVAAIVRPRDSSGLEMKRRALDLFCGAGGATRGLQLAGFHVTGVDIKAQPRYCGDEFRQADALAFPLDGFDFIWASPVCKAWSKIKAVHKHRSYPNYPTDEVAATRERIKTAGVPYVLENVAGAPLSNPFMLCGLMFGLKVLRHRQFEASFLVPTLVHPRHTGSTNSWRGMGKGGELVCVTGHNFLMSEAKPAMGIDWMVQSEISQAIPPAYAEFIGEQALRVLDCAA